MKRRGSSRILRQDWLLQNRNFRIETGERKGVVGFEYDVEKVTGSCLNVRTERSTGATQQPRKKT